MNAARVLPPLIAMLLIGPVWAPASAQELGRDYTQLTVPQTPGTPGKIEVIEFFSWGCSHCARMHPLISEWEKTLPDNAVLVKTPISLGHREWGQLVRAYYALESLGELNRLDGAVFDAIHREFQPLYTEDRLAAWVATQGVDEQKFRQAFNSPEVSARAAQAEQLARNYRVNQTPQLAVHGRYLVRGQSHEESLQIAGKLIEKAASGE